MMALAPEALGLYDFLRRSASLGDYTQPMTIAEIDAAREFRNQTSTEPYVPSTPIDDGPNPGEMELDWFAINKEFS